MRNKRKKGKLINKWKSQYKKKKGDEVERRRRGVEWWSEGDMEVEGERAGKVERGRERKVE